VNNIVLQTDAANVIHARKCKYEANSQYLNRDECFRQPESSGQEDANNFANVGRNQIADEL
jgi:hypothetical protein